MNPLLKVTGSIESLGTCAMIIFKGFGSDYTLNKSDVSKKDINEFLDINEKHQRERMGMSTALITLNDAQMSKLGELFKDRGYIFSEPMWHPKHRTRMFLGYLPLQKDPGVEVVPIHNGTAPSNYGEHDLIFRKSVYENGGVTTDGEHRSYVLAAR